MERLTDKRMKGEGFIPVGPKEYKAFIKNEKPTGKQIYQRLLEIEDILGDDYDLDRLRELVEADRDGRCIVLPCKVGDTIYKLFCGDIVELEVERIVCWSNGYWKMNAHTEYSRADWKGFEIDFSDFGKTVFLTREAAEAALKGDQHG